MRPLKQTPTRNAFVVRRVAVEKFLENGKGSKEQQHNKENWKSQTTETAVPKNAANRLKEENEPDLGDRGVPLPSDIRQNEQTRVHEKVSGRREETSTVRHQLKTKTQLTSKTPKKSYAGIRKRQSSSHQKQRPNPVTPHGILATSVHVTAHSCLGEEEQETETPTARQYRHKLEQIRSHLRLMKAETTRRSPAKILESMYESRREISPKRPPAFSTSPSRSPIKSALSSRQTSPVHKQLRSISPFRAFTESSKAYKPLTSPIRTEFQRRSPFRSASPRRYPAMGGSHMNDSHVPADAFHRQYQTGHHSPSYLQSSVTKSRPSSALLSGQKSPSIRKRSPCRKMMPERPLMPTSMLSRSRVPVRLGDFATSKRKEFIKGLEQAYRELLADDAYEKPDNPRYRTEYK